MRAGIGFFIALVVAVVPATAAAQGADLGYGGILGEQELAPPGGGGGPGQPGAVAEVPAAGGIGPAEAGEGVSAPQTRGGGDGGGAGAGGSLPFTGLDLAAIAAAGMVMVLMGAALRRRSTAGA